MNISTTNYIILSPPTKNCIHKIFKLVDNNPIKWAYFGEDVMNAIDIEKLIGDRGERIDITDDLQETARSLRRSYIDYVGELNVGLPNWWATTISEKNPFISTTFLYICYLKVCKELFETNQSVYLVIFVENHALRKTIFKNFSDRHSIDYIDNKLGDFFNNLKDQIKLTAQKMYCVLNNILYILIVKYYYKLDACRYTHLENKSLLLLRDWIDYRSFDSNGRYQSAYFGKLNEYLRSSGKSVATLPYISNINKKTLKQIVKSNESFIIPHSFMDIISILSKLLVKTPALKSYPAFESLDVKWLIQNDFKKDGFRFIDALLYYDIIKNLNNKNFCFESCIYPYENYPDEKIFCTGMRTYYPSTKLIGFQHSTAPKMLLPYFFSNKESISMPFPDKIITNGSYFTSLFIDEGYPPEKIITGSAIRYYYLYDNRDFKYIKDYKKSIYNILVTSSIGINETLELLTKVIKAFGEKQKYKVTIKYHPAMKTTSIKKYIQKFPSNLHISEKPIPELLKDSDLLIYTLTGACFEALYVGVPVLHVKSSYFIDLDMFDYEQSSIYSVKNFTEIIQMSDELLKMDEKKLKSKQTIWKQVVEKMFSPINESTYKLFELQISN